MPGSEEDTKNKEISALYEKNMLYAYPLQVAMALNLSTEEISRIDTFKEFCDLGIYRSLSCNAMRAKDIRAALDEKYYVKLEKEGFDSLWDVPEIQELHKIMTKEHITEGLKDVDLLIFSLSEGDLLYLPVNEVLMKYPDVYTNINGDVIKYFIELFIKEFKEYKENMVYLLNEFKRINPDMDIVLTGLFNPFQENDINDIINSKDEQIPQIIQSLSVVLYDIVNNYLRKLADIYPNVIYVDINGAIAMEEKDGHVTGDDHHPSIAGHQFIARRILSALPQRYINDRLFDISVDLFGSCEPDDTITAVYVDGIRVPSDNYSKSGFSVSIHRNWILAKQITVVTEGNGKTGINTWNCVWNITDGYRTYSLLKVSDLDQCRLHIKNRINELFNKNTD